MLNRRDKLLESCRHRRKHLLVSLFPPKKKEPTDTTALSSSRGNQSNLKKTLCTTNFNSFSEVTQNFLLSEYLNCAIDESIPTETCRGSPGGVRMISHGIHFFYSYSLGKNFLIYSLHELKSKTKTKN